MSKAIDNWKAGQKRDSSPDLDCRQCEHSHDETKPEDEVVWGECWALPPAMLMDVTDAGCVAISVNATVQLPYCCSLFKPRLN